MSCSRPSRVLTKQSKPVCTTSGSCKPCPSTTYIQNPSSYIPCCVDPQWIQIEPTINGITADITNSILRYRIDGNIVHYTLNYSSINATFTGLLLLTLPVAAKFNSSINQITGYGLINTDGTNSLVTSTTISSTLVAFTGSNPTTLDVLGNTTAFNPGGGVFNMAVSGFYEIAE